MHDATATGDGPSPNRVARERKTRAGSRALTETVHARIRDAILSAELRPNRRLVESELAEWLDASRTPVREALLRLAQEGFVERGRGWVVRERKPSDIRERLECRLAIEGYAARLAAARRDAGHIMELERLAAAMTAGGLSRQAYNDLNDSFHNVIMDAARNPTLEHLHGQTRMNYWDLSVPVIFSADNDRAVAGHHRGLVDAIKDGNADDAERVARDHVQLTMDIVIAELETRYGRFEP